MRAIVVGTTAGCCFGCLLSLAPAAAAREAELAQIPEIPAAAKSVPAPSPGSPAPAPAETAAPEATAPEAAAPEVAAPEATVEATAPAPSAEPLLGKAPGVPPTKERRIVLTISGGISLGSYEAGLNWALLRLIKASRSPSPPDGAFAYPMDLVAMTEASAGNINAFLSAVEWLSSPSEGHPTTDPRWSAEGNLFWDAWIPVGLDQLFPGDRSCEEYKLSLGDREPAQAMNARTTPAMDCFHGARSTASSPG